MNQTTEESQRDSDLFRRLAFWRSSSNRPRANPDRTKTINVARDFSRTPTGRTRDDGDCSAQAFLEDILEPAYKSADHVSIELDGVDGYSASFLMAAFGKLAQRYSSKEVLKKVALVSMDTVLCKEIEGYIRDPSASL